MAVHESSAGAITVGVPSVVEVDGGVDIEQQNPAVDEAVLSDGDGVSSVVVMLPEGFRHDVVYAAREDAVSSFTVDLAVPAGVQAVQAGSAVDLVAGGDVVAEYRGGVAFDASTEQRGGGETPVRTQVIGSEPDHITVQVSIDAGWLSSPLRRFPVTIDPTYTSVVGVDTGSTDTYANSKQPTVGYSSATDLRVGRAPDGSIFRSFVKFGLTSIPAGAAILSANMQFHNIQSNDCTGASVQTRLLTGAISGVNWNTQPGVGSLIDDSTYAHGATGCAAAWSSSDITATAQSWYASPSSNYGVRVNAAESTTVGYKRFDSAQAGSSVAPRLVVTYDRVPAASVPVSPANGASVPTLRPQLTATTVTDPDGEAVQYWFRAWTADGFPANGQTSDSGWISSPSWQPPDGIFGDDTEYSWAVWVHGGSGATVTPDEYHRIHIDRRLGGDPAGTETAGPVTVNLATGGAQVDHTSVGTGTLGGGIAPGFAYRTQSVPNTGLTGQYWNDTNDNGVFDDGNPLVERLDSTLQFDWSYQSPHDAITQEHFLARWSGFITVPRSATYFFGASASNGVKLVVNGTTLVNRWPNNPAAGTAYGASMALTAGQKVPVTMEVVDRPGDGAWARLNYKDDLVADAPVPTSWLTPARRVGTELLSSGWDLDLGDAQPQWTSARVTSNAITLVRADGTSESFRRSGTGAYAAVAGADAVVALTADGRVTASDGGTNYAFAADGSLQSMASGIASDSTLPTYTWSSVATGGVTYRRITALTDPVSGRQTSVKWNLPGTTCPSAPTGFDTAAPVGSLCEVAYWNGTTTRAFYSSGQLGRIVDPGGQTTDYRYNTSGVLSGVREPLAHDAMASGVRADDSSTLTEIAYTAGRATTVTLPAGMAGDARATASMVFGTSSTDVDWTGRLGTGGYSRRVTHDSSGRVTSDVGANGDTTTTAWNPSVDDQQWSVTSPDGTMQTFLYDGNGELTESYGPAPSSWFGGDRRPVPAHVNDVPKDTVALDQGIAGLGSQWYPNATLGGIPSVQATGVGGAGGALSATWAVSPTGSSPYSGRFGGTIRFPVAGTYTMTLAKNGAARAWIGEALVVDGWSSPGTVTGTTTVAAAGTTLPIRVEYASSATGTGSLALRWTPPASGDVVVPGSALRPAYSAPTAAATGAGDVSYAYGATGPDPSYALPTSEVVDPGGLALETTTTYEPDGTGYRRVLTRTLPAGNGWTYAYYGATEQRDNPCTPASDPAPQGGALKTRTGPAPTGAGGQRIDEFVYDGSGRLVARRVGTGDWTCWTYDSRGRVLSELDPAFGGAPARTTDYDWAVGGAAGPGNGNPLVTSRADATGTVTTTLDILGRTVSTQDVYGSTTTVTLDRNGRAVRTDVTAGGQTWRIDATRELDGQIDALSLDTKTIADATYGTDRLLASVAYPTGIGKVGNGSTGFMAYDTNGRLKGLAWQGPSSASITSDTVTFDAGDRMVDEVIDGVDATPSGQSFVYDGASRLTSATYADRNATTGAPTGTTSTFSYGFAATGGCGALATAGRNTDRTSMSLNGTQVATYCYDNADRLTSTTQSGYSGSIAYDSRGNTTAIAGETRRYDGSDRHMETMAGSTTVTYARDADGRITERRVNGTVEARYAYGDNDAPIAVLDASGALATRLLGLPGGAMYSDSGLATASRWYYPNVRGDVAAVGDGSGGKVGTTYLYDAFGAPLATMIDTASGALDWGFLGQHQRGSEHQSGLALTVEMGARQYDPVLGRFLSVDPVEAGSANSYDYCNGDPMGCTDLSGRYSIRRNCGTVTCSLYWSRDLTALIGWMFAILHGYPAVAAASLLGGLICLPTGGWGALLCAVLTGLYAQVVSYTMQDAARKKRCFKVTYKKYGQHSITWISTNNGSYCHNR